MKESEFRRKIKTILESKGWLCFTLVAPVRTIMKGGKQIWIPSRGQPFDLIAIKSQLGIPIEVKTAKGYYGKEQKQTQINLANKSETVFALIKQSNQRGKITLEFPNQVCNPNPNLEGLIIKLLSQDLKELIE